MTLIHQFWHDDNPPLAIIGEWLSWDHDYVLWTPSSIPDELSRFLDFTRGQVAESQLLRHTANIVRLWVLERFGGVWLDHDVIPDPAQLRPSTFPWPFMAAHDTCCNCVMAFEPHHPMIQEALHKIRWSPNSSSYKSTEVSGEGMLQNLLTPDVQLRQLPFDAAGQPLEDGTNWAVHLYATSGRLARCL